MASLEAESPPLEFGATLPENQTRSGLALRDNVQNDVRGSGMVRDTLDAETEPECASTALDPTSRPPTQESPGAVARRVTKIPSTLQGQHHQYHDDLLDALAKKLDASGDSCSPSDPDDSGTATEDEAQSHKLKRQRTQPEQLQEHWTMNETLLQNVEDFLASCIHEPWYDGSFFYSSGQMKPWTFQACLFEIANYIRTSIQGRCICYKVGITENPGRRWKLYKNDKNTVTCSQKWCFCIGHLLPKSTTLIPLATWRNALSMSSSIPISTALVSIVQDLVVIALLMAHRTSCT